MLTATWVTFFFLYWLHDHWLKPSCSHTPSCSMWKKFWNISTLPNVHMFMWKALQNWVACWANLARRKRGTNPTCPIWENLTKTLEHLLFHCPLSKAGWFGSNKAFWVFQKEIVLVDWWMEDRLCGELAKVTSRQDTGEILQICWAIWRARNNFVFNNKLSLSGGSYQSSFLFS